MDNFSKMTNDYKQLKSVYEKESEMLNKTNAKREAVIRLYFDSLGDLRQEKAQLSNCENDIDRLKDDVEKFQKEINSLTSQKNSLENKIPELEKEKKGFVTSRSFKVISSFKTVLNIKGCIKSF